MAKSQYTDSITGEVIYDTRIIGNKLIDYSNFKNTYLRYIYSSKGSIQVVSGGKYSEKSIKLTMNNSDYNGVTLVGAVKKINTVPTSFTISWWANIITYGSHSQEIYISDQNSYNKSIIGILGGSSSYYPMIQLNLPGKDSWESWNLLTSAGTSNLNTWYHYAVTYTNNTFRYFRNGTLLTTRTFNNFFTDKLICIEFRTGYSASASVMADDIVFITNQALWTSNFTVPNYFLTGDHTINKLHNKSIIYPIPIYNGDYFDKAFIY